LGGAEIFTLERMLQGDSDDDILYCNSQLAESIRRDVRYSGLVVRSEACLDGLAHKTTIANILDGVRMLRPILEDGGVLFGNLRAAAMLLHPAIALRNEAFIHDNSHYLNLKARILMALVVALSTKTSFACRHSTLRVPFHQLLSRRMAIDYFGSYRLLDNSRGTRPTCLKMAVIGRIEPAKNQRLAFDIANRLAVDFTRVHLTLVGAPSDLAYYSEIMVADRHPALELTQQEVPRGQMPALLQKQDLVVHTSIAESLPLVLFEANTLGVPFFALPVGGIPELLPNEYWLDMDVEESVRKISKTLYNA
jgi:glycosyltransferase involved in cell wall biosynthesis